MSDFFKVMIIDDEEDYAESLKDRAAYKDIDLTHIQNLEDGLAELYENYSNYDGLILDGKGYLTAEETSATSLHIHKALRELNEYDREGKIIPRLINTGYFDEFEDIQKIDDIKVFDKSGDEDEMFDALKEMIQNSDMYKYRREYPNIFSLFAKKYFPERKELDLVQILNALNSQEQSVIKANLGLIRTFMEPFYEAIYLVGEEIGEELMPKEFIQGGVTLAWCERYVTLRKVDVTFKEDGEIKEKTYKSSKRIVPNHIGWELSEIRNLCSEAGSHDYVHKVSNITLQSATYSLLNILDWYYNWLEELKNN